MWKTHEKITTIYKSGDREKYLCILCGKEENDVYKNQTDGSIYFVSG